MTIPVAILGAILGGADRDHRGAPRTVIPQFAMLIGDWRAGKPL